ncbi:carotenoid ester lipase precursor [Rickenella mellea]|uniref:Carboxylic ester hydrolase n=1 Tax=Rickenella mellea TaxID=50990 RepID=A0A4Y7PHV7_9AGAM|nr:carotenoid ester lipase precursor [Rickenella mellea]
MLVSTLISTIALASVVVAVPVERGIPPTVILPNGIFQGSTSGNLTSFLGIPYAQPPVGKLRFAPPQAPSFSLAIKQATSFGASCIQQLDPFPPLFKRMEKRATNASEDCLFVNVIRPANIPFLKQLPVVFWIYGGKRNSGFEDGDSSNNPGNTVVQRSIDLGEPVIYVSVNYRLNAFGFLPGKEVKAAGIGNIGLRDQRFALEWVQKFIWEFGGDASKVTIWGQSAGAISVALQMLTNDGNTQGLFRGAFMESGSPIPAQDITTGQQYYDQLVQNTGCASSSDTLECLREVPVDTLVAAVNESPNLFAFQSLTIAWKPLVDGVFLKRNPQDSVAQGLYAKIPFVTGDVDDEGTIFSVGNKNITTDDEFANYVKTNYVSGATDAQVAQIVQAYPSDPTAGSPYDTGTNNQLTPEFKRLASFQGDLVFQSTRRFFLQTASKTQNAWSYLYKRGKASPFFGASHGSEVPEFYGALGTDFIGTDALVNFVNTLNPNGPKNSISLLSALDWPQWASNSTAPPLLTFLDPAPSISITPDTYRLEAMNVLIQISRAIIP